MELVAANAIVARSHRDRADHAPQRGDRRVAKSKPAAGLLAGGLAAISRLVARRERPDHPEAIGATDRELARLNRPAWSIRDERERAARLANLRRPM